MSHAHPASPNYTLVRAFASMIDIPENGRPLSVLIALENQLDREAYAARIARDPRFRIAASPTDTLRCDVQLVDHCNGDGPSGDGGPPAVLLIDTRPNSAGRKPCSCCYPVPRSVGWRRLLEALAGVAGEESSGYAAPKSELDHLTPRERDVLGLVGRGLSVPQSAVELGLSASTVGNHKHRLMRKLGVKTSLQLLLIALRHGLADLNESCECGDAPSGAADRLGDGAPAR